MINANELRRNNWILEDGKPIRVDEIRHWYFGDAEPIPITAEILEKAGFEYEGVTTLTKEKFPVYFKKNGANLSAHAFYLLTNVPVPCECVHQLQNLYFALTGEELTINL